MKNQLTYHLVPTEDASFLEMYDALSVCRFDNTPLKSHSGKNYHLYLCSDTEPIKEGEYYIDSNGEVVKLKKIDVHINQSSWKKILFTTDPKLWSKCKQPESCGSSLSKKCICPKDGVLPIDGNTKVRIDLTKEAFKKYPYLSGVDKYNDTYDANEYNRNEWIKKNEIVNFLTEFCERWNGENRDIEAIKRLEEVWGDDEGGKYAELYNHRQRAKRMDVENITEKDFLETLAEGNSSKEEYARDCFELAREMVRESLESYETLRNTGQFSLEDIRKFLDSFTDVAPASYIKSEFEKGIFNRIKSLTVSKGEMVIGVEMEEEFVTDFSGTHAGGCINYKIKLKDGQPTLIFK